MADKAADEKAAAEAKEKAAAEAKEKAAEEAKKKAAEEAKKKAADEEKKKKAADEEKKKKAAEEAKKKAADEEKKKKAADEEKKKKAADEEKKKAADEEKKKKAADEEKKAADEEEKKKKAAHEKKAADEAKKAADKRMITVRNVLNELAKRRRDCALAPLLLGATTPIIIEQIEKSVAVGKFYLNMDEQGQTARGDVRLAMEIYAYLEREFRVFSKMPEIDRAILQNPSFNGVQLADLRLELANANERWEQVLAALVRDALFRRLQSRHLRAQLTVIHDRGTDIEALICESLLILAKQVLPHWLEFHEQHVKAQLFDLVQLSLDKVLQAFPALHAALRATPYVPNALDAAADDIFPNGVEADWSKEVSSVHVSASPEVASAKEYVHVPPLENAPVSAFGTASSAPAPSSTTPEGFYQRVPAATSPKPMEGSLLDHISVKLMAEVYVRIQQCVVNANKDFCQKTDNEKRLKRSMWLNGPPMAYHPSNTTGATPAQPQVTPDSTTKKTTAHFFRGFERVKTAAATKHLTQIEMAQGEAAIDDLLNGASRLSDDEGTFAKLVESCEPDDAFRLDVMSAVIAFYHPRLVGLIVSSYNDNVWDQVPTLLTEKKQGTPSHTAEDAREKLIKRLEQLVSPTAPSPSTPTACPE
ncbi:uncharacterized protein MONBRDRAFT_38903 [Monosiga brevicollis MX1]|uniref:Uncharacterized protein n=1 Tax=Monosiga brevicollis TaxID=81824 RepID=A9VAW5_MONBE|nr:uncharacterized protein MONBRDRAFT_38903 [Monosiga brevicollis MX1]EDQ85236.1 predicted protein [Monosiga brevicollis MX1]|eukprot:XP_001749857.1 hypothetical protein [Monosiga brevicollis MX1]